MSVGESAGDEVAGEDVVHTSHPVRAGVITAAAALLILFALVLPNQLTGITAAAFVRIPVDVILGVIVAVVLPDLARRVVGIIAGVALGVLTIGKALDIGFYGVFDRAFDPVGDWGLLDNGVEVLTRSVGRVGAVAVAVAAVATAVAVLVLLPMSVLRITAAVRRDQHLAIGAAALLTFVWVTCFLVGAQIAPGVPVAAGSEAVLAGDRVRQVEHGLEDRRAFALQLNADPNNAVPADRLLTALRGKDVLLVFVESYGRVAIEDHDWAQPVNAVLASGTRQLNAAGFGSRSAFLNSPTAGGLSWLAHSTLQSGLRIDNQQRYDELVGGERLTLSGAFHRAGWRTVDVVTANKRDWPEGRFYGFDKIYDARNIGYRGPDTFNFASIPDQFVLSAFHRLELARVGRPPVMAEIDLLTSHAPWAPLPTMIDWNELGDGSVFGPMPAEGQSEDFVWKNANRVRAAYGQSIEYSLTALFSYIQLYGDKNLVVIFLGDHQPNTIVAGAGANRNVPISIVSADPQVLERVAGWGWSVGLKPDPTAPVWPMDTFRDRFLTAYGPNPAPATR